MSVLAGVWGAGWLNSVPKTAEEVRSSLLILVQYCTVLYCTVLYIGNILIWDFQ